MRTYLPSHVKRPSLENSAKSPKIDILVLYLYKIYIKQTKDMFPSH